MEEKKWNLENINDFFAETAGQDILRYVGVPAILGHEKETLLYFTGKYLARKIEYHSLNEVYDLFHKLKWGNLELVKEKKHQMTFHLMSDDIVRRLKSPVETEFQLEAGFLAESVQQLYHRSSECTETVNQRLFRVEFKVFFTD